MRTAISLSSLSFFLIPLSSFAAINASQTLVLQTGGIERARITSAGISATAFIGDGSALTNISGAGIPTKTTTQRNAMSPVAGTIIYNSTTNRLEWFNGSDWFTHANRISATLDTTSCKTILDTGGSIGNGLYTLSGGLNVYCDMTTSGGGWTMIVAQYETDPVTNWNEGTQPDYDPSLATRKGFALSTSQIPAHTQTAFGQDLNPTAVDYFNYAYTTGNITKTAITGLKGGASYHIYRSTSLYYNYHDPENASYTDSAPWLNALSIDRTGGQYNDWAFSPNATLSGTNSKGYAMSGQHLEPSSQTYAWTVWVR